jgi:Domain of unknown function (DUF4314)
MTSSGLIGSGCKTSFEPTTSEGRPLELGSALKPLTRVPIIIYMSAEPRDEHERTKIPSKGDRIELLRTETGVRVRGTVYYADQLQILVKWDNGRSQSLRPGVDRFRIISRPAARS